MTTRQGKLNTFYALVLIIISIVISVVFTEILSRLYWSSHGVPFSQPNKILYAHYPELRWIDEKPPRKDDIYFDILLLGGSVLHNKWGTAEHELRDQLAQKGYRHVRIHNLAMPAHTSRDSWLKYMALGESQFDLVIVYHGVNETRANNIPSKYFKQDYSHYTWYEILNSLAPYHNNTSVSFLYSLRFIKLRIKQIMQPNLYIPFYYSKDEWTHYGKSVKSQRPFNNNLEKILNSSSNRGEDVLLMTFAYYAPEDYSKTSFEKKCLDYGVHLTSIETWGNKDNVVAGIKSHNDVVRKLISINKKVMFVDQEKQMAKNSENFNDMSHLTTIGASRFVENIIFELLPRLEECSCLIK